VVLVVALLVMVSSTLLFSCTESDPPTTLLQPSAPRASVSPPPRAQPTTPAIETPATHSSTHSSTVSTQKSCPSPWVLLKRTWVGDQSGVKVAKALLAQHTEFEACDGSSPTQPRQLCVFRVRYYGAKYRTRSNLHRNRDAVVAQCFTAEICERFAALFKAKEPASNPKIHCTGPIPISGSLVPIVVPPRKQSVKGRPN